MEKTTVQYFCDRCEKELPCRPVQTHITLRGFGMYGLRSADVKVCIQYEADSGVLYKDSMLCDDCKIKALEEVLRELKGEQQ